MKNHYLNKHNCIYCNVFLEKGVFEYSIAHFGIPFCITHQNQCKIHYKNATKQELMLYVALIQRNVPAELQKHDGHKTIDIAVVRAKVNIEVDGGHHNLDHNQALIDLKRTYHAFKKGYLTLRIPNSIVENHLEETADVITNILLESLDQLLS
jgi:very-short-patch-repair endonuclease